MKRSLTITLLLLGLSISTHAKRNPDNTNKMGISVSIPALPPFELGVDFKHMHKNKWGWCLNYRLGLARSKSIPNDYKEYPHFSVGLGNLFENYIFETIQTLAIRAVYQQTVLSKYVWVTEAGPCYNKYSEITYVINQVADEATYSRERIGHHLLGLSINNSVALIRKGKVSRLSLFLYNDINTRFSYTTFGLHFNLGDHRL